MDKTAIKNFSIWARNKLIADITYKAGLLGVTEEGIKDALPQSTRDAEFYDIGMKEPYVIHGEEIKQRKELVASIKRKSSQLDYKDAYRNVVEEVAYTWFNRLIAIRFMEVNDYMPAHIRVLSSDSKNKLEPDLVTTPFDAELEFTKAETEKIMQMKNDNQVDALFRFLFIKQCNALNAYLPKLFEKTSDYTELLLNVSVTDQDGIVYHLIHDINEDDFNISNIGEDGKPTGQVEIIGWMYQYYNTELNELVYDGSMSKSRVGKELLPAATTIYTPDWAIRYMVENSIGRLWLEGHEDKNLKSGWIYYLDEAEQEADVAEQLDTIRNGYKNIKPEEIKVIDPCMGSGHILVYAFEVLMQIYESYGYSQRDAAKSIVENNIYGLDIDDRAFQLAYFAIMMKARSYNRRFLTLEIEPNLCAVQESNDLRYDSEMAELFFDEKHKETLQYLLKCFCDAKEYGSILSVEERDYTSFVTAWEQVEERASENIVSMLWYKECNSRLHELVKQAEIISGKYDIIVTNPPYLGSSRFSPKLDTYVKKYYPDEKADLSMVMYKMAMKNMSKNNAYSAFITTSSWIFLTSFEKIRNYVFEQNYLSTIVDFGTELFEGKVGHNPIVAWISRKAKLDYKLTAVRLVDYCYSRRAEKKVQYFNKENHFSTVISNFERIPGKPFAYWVKQCYIPLFENKTINEIDAPRFGMSTSDNNRFVRAWYEIDIQKFSYPQSEIGLVDVTKKWYPYNNGGEFRRWYGNNYDVVNWANDGEEIKNFGRAAVRNKDFYLRRGITWSAISSAKISVRSFDYGFLFSSAGFCIFSYKYEKYILALLNSKVGMYFLKIFSPTMNFNVGDIARIPVIAREGVEDIVEKVVSECIEISKGEWNDYEISWDFVKHPLAHGNSIKGAFESWERKCQQRFRMLKEKEQELNKLFISIYGLEDELDFEIVDKDIAIKKANEEREIKSLLSYAIGCILGRYDIDGGIKYAGGTWNSETASDFSVSEYNIIPITDEEYLEDDIICKLIDWLIYVYGKESLEENLDYIASALGNQGDSSRETIRNYFLKDFYSDHIKMYQKKPIYWQFSSGKQKGFKALIYMHRYNADTIGNLRVDYLHRMERIYESEINRMQDTIDNSSNAREVTAATKRKEKLQKQLKECQEYDEKIGHLALSRIDIDLDDGVKINYEKVQTANDGKKYQVLTKI